MIRRSLGLTVIAAVLLLCSGPLALAQSVVNAGIRGHIENDNAGLPGVTVSLRSANLQGERTATTSANGDFQVVGLPPGEYTVTLKLSGFETVTRTVTLSAAQTASLDAKMAVAGVTAAATVVARTETVSTTTQAQTTISTELSNKLPIARTILSEVALAAGVNLNGPGGAATISGGMSFENLFTVDGAVIMDNVRATPNNLFVEDAIQETTTSTSSVSAEFGRFQGGVVNTVTKSGGNTFSGSFRTTLTNDAWSAITPSHETRLQSVLPRYEMTLGGPFWKDHVWFFGSGRISDLSQAMTTNSLTAIPFQYQESEKRYQGKLTLTPFANQTLTGNFLKVDDQQTNYVYPNSANVLDTLSFVNRSLPQQIITANYNGVITSNFFVEGLYSNRKFTFEHSGSLFTDLIQGTLMRDRALSNARYNAPTFCGICDPEERNNRDFYVKGTYFLSTPSLGSHNVVLGYDNFSGSRKANNYQSGSNYRVFTTNAIFSGGDLFPVIDNRSYVYYTPIDTLSKGTDTLTHSVFLNDAWRLNDRLSFNLGVRFDKNNAKDSRGIVTADDHSFSPRLAAAFDATGTGSLKVNASYAHYVGAIQDNLVDSSSNAGAPSTFIWYINGFGAPVINSPVSGPLVTRAAALQSVFNWFFAQGCPNLTTCKLPLAYANVPGYSRQIQGGLSSPYTREYSVGVNGTVGGAGSYRVDAIRREGHDFYNTVLNVSTGRATDPLGNHFDLGINGNTNTDLERNYTALQTQFQYRLFNNRLNLGGSWTWSHTIGNDDGETTTNGPIPAAIDVYPEYKQVAWNAPRGDLLTDQRHRIRLFATYDLPFVPASFGSVSVSGLQSYDTGVPYGAVGAVASKNYVTNPGYLTPPSTVVYYFTARDAFRTDNIKRTDLSVNFSTKVGGLVEIFFQPQVLNVFNNKGTVAVSTSVQYAANTSGYLPFNPFTTTPVQGARNTTTPTANWNFAPGFGGARNNLDYQLPRTYQATMGVRF